MFQPCPAAWSPPRSMCPSSHLGHSRPGRASSKSGHVRYAPKAEVILEHWRLRDRPLSTPYSNFGLKPRGFQPKSRMAGVGSKVMSFIIRVPIATLEIGKSGFASAKPAFHKAGGTEIVRRG